MNTDAEHTEQLIARYSGTTPVLSRWSYRSSEPFTITAAFQTSESRWVEWVFARDLLVEGLIAPSGLGDVLLRPDGFGGIESLVLEISSPEGHAMLELELAAVDRFLARTMAMVPLGEESEHFDVDKLIDEITNV